MYVRGWVGVFRLFPPPPCPQMLTDPMISMEVLSDRTNQEEEEERPQIDAALSHPPFLRACSREELFFILASAACTAFPTHETGTGHPYFRKPGEKKSVLIVARLRLHHGYAVGKDDAQDLPGRVPRHPHPCPLRRCCHRRGETFISCF